MTRDEAERYLVRVARRVVRERDLIGYPVECIDLEAALVQLRDAIKQHDQAVLLEECGLREPERLPCGCTAIMVCERCVPPLEGA